MKAVLFQCGYKFLIYTFVVLQFANCKLYRLPKQINLKIVSVYSHHNLLKVCIRSCYIGSVTWASPTILSVSWLTRSQTSLYYSLCPPPLYQCNTVSIITTLPCYYPPMSATQIAVDTSYNRPGQGWVENHGAPFFSQDGTRMAVIMSTDQGEAGYFPHLVVFRQVSFSFISTVRLVATNIIVISAFTMRMFFQIFLHKLCHLLYPRLC